MACLVGWLADGFLPVILMNLGVGANIFVEIDSKSGCVLFVLGEGDVYQHFWTRLPKAFRLTRNKES